MKKQLNWDKKLESLLHRKNFDALNANERRYVQQHLSEEDYTKYRTILLNSKQHLKQHKTIASPKVKANLMAAMATKHKQQSTLKAIASYPIPLWQVAASAAILVLSVLNFWPKQQTIPPAEKEIVYVHKTDTVYKEVAPVVKASLAASTDSILMKPKKKAKKQVKTTIPIIIKSPKKMISPVITNNSPIPKSTINRRVENPLNFPPLQEANVNISPFDKTGRSVTTDSDLMEFVGKVY